MMRLPHPPGDGAQARSNAIAEMNRTPLPRWADVVCALAVLTRIPLRRPDPHSEEFGRATLFFPLVGLAVGAVLLAVDVWLSAWCPRWAVAIVVVAAWELLTAEWNPRVTYASSARSAVYWVMQGVKLAAVSAAAARPVALLFAPMLASWAVVVLAVGARDAETPGRKFNTAINFREFAVTSVFAFVVVFTIAEALGIVVVLAVAAATLMLRLVAHRRYGGVGEQVLSASARAIELFVLLLFALA